ncbi:MAG: hypothetical protein JOY82_05110 [Streptosporangiaceae bacterium]|nr:hypothetical protein [Streptosporangiaceae bacterium]
MRITFRRFPGHSSAYSVIERDDGVVYRMKEFTRPGTELPHDLRHFVVERELGIADGIWGGIAAGMVYTSMDHVRGRRPPHSAERSQELKRAQRQRIMRAELLANLVEAIAMLDAPSGDDIRRLTRAKLSAVPVTEPGADPADVAAVPPPELLAGAARALQVEAARWARLRVGEELVFEWRLAATAAVTRALRAVPRPRETGDRHGQRRTGRRGPR